jgi:hypothetical protein
VAVRHGGGPGLRMRRIVREHVFVSDAELLQLLEEALACRPASLRVGVERRDGVEELARVGLLIDAGDGTVTPTRAAVAFDLLTRP